MELQSQTLSEGFASYFNAKLCLLVPFGEPRILCIFISSNSISHYLKPLHSLISHYTLAGGATLASSNLQEQLIPTIATCKKDPHPHATNVLLPTLQGT